MSCAHDQDSDRVQDSLISHKLNSKESGHERPGIVSYHRFDNYTSFNSWKIGKS